MNKIPGYEKRKVTIDIFKHLATISLAIIAFTITILKQTNLIENSANILLFTVISLFIVIIFSVLAIFILLMNLETLKPFSKSHFILRLSIFITIISFFIGISSLVYLVIDNL